MNIFVTDPDPHISAMNLDDKRVIKMILESAQMLSTAMHVMKVPGAPYKPTHINHPCSVWARESQANYFWLLEHMQYLCMEYKHRYGKTHKCASHLHTLFNARTYMPQGELTPFANCSPHKEIANVYEAYRQTMRDKWANDKRTPGWKNRGKPSWA